MNVSTHNATRTGIIKLRARTLELSLPVRSGTVFLFFYLKLRLMRSVSEEPFATLH